jgi:hypothetical protein
MLNIPHIDIIKTKTTSIIIACGVVVMAAAHIAIVVYFSQLNTIILKLIEQKHV